MYHISKKRGLIRTIVIVIIAIIILSYFGIDLQQAVESKQAQKNFGYVKAVIVVVWERYLQAPVKFIWNIFVEFIWKPAFERIKTGNYTSPTTQLIFYNT